MKLHGFAMLSCLLLADNTDLIAHPGHEDNDVLPVHSSVIREWRREDGSLIGVASFVTVKKGLVRLLRDDGGRSAIAISRLSTIDRTWVRQRLIEIEALNVRPIEFAFAALTREEEKPVPPIQKHFEHFKKLELRSDANYLYIGSDGFPNHPMMKGIKAWQQQVPLPQAYTGKNAWQIPLKPVLADKPISAKNALFRGAIALAVNGVPIFNALNNRGEDAYLIGELDEYGGHCGRADDYHYHMAPVHLEKIVGRGKPIGYALDGFPLYGFTDADGKEPKDLDEFNGRMEKDGYRYYSTRKYPYINGGMRGVVTVRGDQVDPQPRANPVRPAGQPLRGAKITDFVRNDETKIFLLKYEVNGRTNSISYSINKDGTYKFVFADSNGKETTETYRRREGKDGKDAPPPKKGGKDGPQLKKDDPSKEA